jgi:sugar lactone lactonase YvrE
MVEAVATALPVRVLIADGDRRVRSALRRLFAAASGFDVVAVEGTASSALSAAERLHPDVVLVDVLLPDVESGLNLLRRLTADHRLPALALSAQDSVRASALAAGATGFLHKGSAPEAILAAVRSLADPVLLTDQAVYPESPRWHQGRLWFSDVHAFAVKTVEPSGRVSTIVEVPGRPAGLGFLPDGRLLVAGALDRCVWVWDGGHLTRLADLSGVALGLLNDMVVDGAGRAYVGATGFNLMAGEDPRPGQVILVTPDGEAVVVRDDVMFPNGAALSADGRRFYLSETAAIRVSVFDVDQDGGLSRSHTLIDVPDLCDGLCTDADGAVWVALLRRGEFWRVLSDGTLDRVVRAEGRLAVACAFGGPDRQTLFLCSAVTTMDELARGLSSGRIHTMRAPAPGAGWP